MPSRAVPSEGNTRAGVRLLRYVPIGDVGVSRPADVERTEYYYYYYRRRTFGYWKTKNKKKTLNLRKRPAKNIFPIVRVTLVAAAVRRIKRFLMIVILFFFPPNPVDREIESSSLREKNAWYNNINKDYMVCFLNENNITYRLLPSVLHAIWFVEFEQIQYPNVFE